MHQSILHTHHERLLINKNKEYTQHDKELSA